jgi:sulfatase modifying factor 1
VLVVIDNVDINGNRLSTNDLLQACGEYKYPTKCLSKPEDIVHMHFCIDRYEWPNKKGEIPQDWMTWFNAKKEIEAVNKRLCTAREWTLAAEGPNRKPVPYGDGYHRDSSACNFDNHMPKDINVFHAKSPSDEMSQKLRAILVPSGSKERCISDYGVYDMAGNVDEWVVNENSNDLCINRTSGYCRSGLKGGHIWHGRNASRPMTTVHGVNFGWYETGARACKDIR